MRKPAQESFLAPAFLAFTAQYIGQVIPFSGIANHQADRYLGMVVIKGYCRWIMGDGTTTCLLFPPS
jgi:hypothetical protein